MMNLRDGTIILTGAVDGAGWDKEPLVQLGQHGVTAAPSGDIKVEIVGVGLIDRTATKPNMEIIQVRMVQGDSRLLKNAVVIFE